MDQAEAIVISAPTLVYAEVKPFNWPLWIFVQTVAFTLGFCIGTFIR